MRPVLALDEMFAHPRGDYSQPRLRGYDQLLKTVSAAPREAP